MKLDKSFLLAIAGLKTVWAEERNFRIEVVAALFVLVAVLIFGFSLIEIALIIIAICMVITAEIVNTAIEDLCDKIEPQQNVLIGKIKDTMAAFVLISSIGASCIGIAICINHFLI